MADATETSEVSKATEELAKVTLQHDEEDIQKKMAYFLLTKRFYGRSKEDGKNFCFILTDYDDDVEHIFGDQSNKYDYPVLEVVEKFYTDKQSIKEDILKELNETLKKQGQGGLQFGDEDLKKHPFENIDFSNDIDLTKPKNRIPIFREVSTLCGSSARLIAHFLLDYHDIERIVRKNPDKVDTTLKDVLEAWYNSSKPYKSWPYLRALLLYFKKKAVVDKIDGTFDTGDGLR